MVFSKRQRTESLEEWLSYGKVSSGHFTGLRSQSLSMSGAWYVYLLRCSDGTLYTGITTDVGRRLEEHNSGGRLSARYTRARRPVVLCYVEEATTRSEAARREAAIKRLGRSAKELLAMRDRPHKNGAKSG